MVSVLHKELEYKVEKVRYKKLEVMQARIKISPHEVLQSRLINEVYHFISEE